MNEDNRITMLSALVLIAVAVFFARSIYTSHPELGGDARKKWKTSIELVEQGDSSALFRRWHHSVRWGVVLPTAVLNKISGSQLANYYVTPLIFYSILFSFLLFFALKSMHPGLVGFFAVLLFYDPHFFRASTQLQPYVFGVAYIVTSFYFLTVYAHKKSVTALVCASFLAFCAYGAKETYVFFYPGLALFIWIAVNLRAALLLAAMIVGWLVVETAIFNYLSGELRFGRIEYLMHGKHIVEMETKEVGHSYVDLVVSRWLKIPVYNQVMTVVSALFVVYLFAARKFSALSRSAQGILLIALSYCFCVSMIPLSIDPLLPLQPLKATYLIPVMPFMMFCTALAVNSVICGLPPSARTGSVVGVNLITFIFLCYAVFWQSPFTHKHRTNIYPSKQRFLWRYEQVVDRFRDGYGICYHYFWQRKHGRELLGDFYFPALDKDRFKDHTVFTQEGVKYTFFTAGPNPGNEPPGYIRARDMEIVSELESCDQAR